MEDNCKKYRMSTFGTNSELANACNWFYGGDRRCHRENRECCPCRDVERECCPCREEDSTSLCPNTRCIPARGTCCEGKKRTPFCSSNSECAYAHVDLVFDEKEVKGTQIAQSINVCSASNLLTAVYRNCNGCCTAAPKIDRKSQFVVESFCVKVKNAIPARLLCTPDFEINNDIPSSNSVNMIGNDSYEVDLSGYDPNVIFNPRCLGAGKNSKAAVVIGHCGFRVSYIMEYVLCGYVTTCDGTFQFEITFADDDLVTTSGCTTFFVPEICLPNFECGEIASLRASFCFEANLIAPKIEARDGCNICLCDTMIIEPKAFVETIKNERVKIVLCR